MEKPRHINTPFLEKIQQKNVERIKSEKTVESKLIFCYFKYEKKRNIKKNFLKKVQNSKKKKKNSSSIFSFFFFHPKKILFIWNKFLKKNVFEINLIHDIVQRFHHLIQEPRHSQYGLLLHQNWSCKKRYVL